MTLKEMDAVMVIQKIKKVFDSCDTQRQANMGFTWGKMLIKSWVRQSELHWESQLLLRNDLLTRCRDMYVESI